MIKSITVTNYLGDKIKLELTRPELSGFAIESITGLGPAKADVNVNEVSSGDGSIFNSARLGKRNIVFNLVFVDTVNGESIEDVRHKSYRYFPVKKRVLLQIETDNRISETEGYVEHNEPSIFSSRSGCQISIICPHPYLYSANKINTTVFSGMDPIFEFPFSNESLTENMLEIGSVVNKSEHLITYDGDAEIGVVITIKALGEVRHLMIYNTGTREVMHIDTDKLAAMTGSGIIAGDEITICTVKGDKSIVLFRDGKSISILNCLAKDADWFQLVKGDNVFAYTAEQGSSELRFKIENRVIYEGV